ncbi:MAG: class I SAM-dependent methyltransferase [Thermofilaceae archaeon]|nr:class I SAM-dependent methyltransferase [Thermofilaceae archaeon]MCX8180365.1 class I SAM-dependent methyltransferase [Thermofilaceae archaeon]MDW8003900.1 hypothetical protein [Thermofilaceae archaeon]
MPLFSYAVKTFLKNPSRALRVFRVTRELQKYTVWKLYETLEVTGTLARLQEQPWWEFADKDFAKWVCEILVSNGCAEWNGDMVEVLSPPKPCSVTTPDVADMMPVINRAIALVPEILEKGEKPPLSKYRAEYAKTLGNLAHRLAIEVCIEETGLTELPQGAKVLNVPAEVGVATFALLELTRAHVLAVDPMLENVEALKKALKLTGGEERVIVLHAPPEKLTLPEKGDAVLMADAIPYLLNPRLTLMRVRENLSKEGFLAIYQCLYSGTGLTAFLPHYVFGAYKPPPKGDELRELLRQTGFRIVKWLEEQGIAVVRAEHA